MNRMLVVVFDNEKGAEAGRLALHQLHQDGTISVYALGAIARDAKGKVSVNRRISDVPVGTGVGLAVGSLIGLLGGAGGVAVGAVTGMLLGAVRDFWATGVDLEFIEEVQGILVPGKVALVVELEEDSTVSVDACMTEIGGMVYRRARASVGKARVRRDIVAFKAEVAELDSEIKHATGDIKATLASKSVTAKASLDAARARARQAVERLAREAEEKQAALRLQLAQDGGAAKELLETRIAHVRHGFDKRRAKLSKAWGLAKEALAV